MSRLKAAGISFAMCSTSELSTSALVMPADYHRRSGSPPFTYWAFARGDAGIHAQRGGLRARCLVGIPAEVSLAVMMRCERRRKRLLTPWELDDEMDGRGGRNTILDFSGKRAVSTQKGTRALRTPREGYRGVRAVRDVGDSPCVLCRGVRSRCRVGCRWRQQQLMMVRWPGVPPSPREVRASCVEGPGGYTHEVE
jgi:hypothetical protein